MDFLDRATERVSDSGRHRLFYRGSNDSRYQLKDHRSLKIREVSE